MIPPMSTSPLVTEEQRTRLVEMATTAHRRYNAPPIPVGRLEEIADGIHSARFSWTQPLSEPADIAGASTAEEGCRRIAEAARATPNPLRDLAAELARYADALDRQGIVPLGVHLCTVHNPDPRSFAASWDGGPVVATVVTTVRGVSREWVDRTSAAPSDAPSDETRSIRG